MIDALKADISPLIHFCVITCQKDGLSQLCVGR